MMYKKFSKDTAHARGMMSRNDLETMDRSVKNVLDAITIGKITPEQAMTAAHGDMWTGSVFHFAKYLTLRDKLKSMGYPVE